MNKVINGVKVEVARRSVRVTETGFTFKGGLYSVEHDAISIERAKWPKRQLLVLDYEIGKPNPLRLEASKYEQDAERVGLLVGKKAIKTLLHSNEQLLIVMALMGMVLAAGMMSFIMYLQGHPETFMSEQQRTAWEKVTAGQPAQAPPGGGAGTNGGTVKEVPSTK